MKIKEKKTHVMQFNFFKTRDFPPELNIDGFQNQLEVVSQTMLLGVMLTLNGQ